MPPQARRRTARKKDDDSPGMKIEVDGRTYIVRESDLSPRDIRELRRETGFSWAGLGRELQRDPDIDLIGALVWLARRLDGDQVSYDEVLDGLSYDSDLNLSLEDKRGEKAEGDSPEA
jgi:hypothetical protein